MTITLDNQTFPVRANMRAWRNYERKTGNKVASIDAEDVRPCLNCCTTLWKKVASVKG